MKNSDFNHKLTKKAYVFLTFFILFLLFILFSTYNKKNINNPIVNNPTPTQNPTPNTYEPYRTTMEGNIDCIPHKNTTGPQTLECLIGLKSVTGDYYLFDTKLMSQTAPEYTTGDRIRANGVVTPIERLSTDSWQKYNVKGIFSVTDSFEIL